MPLRLQESLHVFTGSGWQQLPAWCNFFFELGSAVASTRSDPARTIVGLAVPTRAYAAPFVALGVVSTHAATPIIAEDNAEYFEKLTLLPRGKPLIYIANGRRLKGRHDGVEGSGSDRILRVMVESKESGGLTRLIQAEDAKSIEIAEVDDVILPATQRGKQLLKNQEFVERLLPGVSVSDFAGHSRMECEILGRLNILRSEIVDTRFGFLGKKSLLNEGSLQDILRARKFSGVASAVRSNVHRVDGKHPPRPTSSTEVVIFDGAEAYLKARSNWSKNNAVVILDAVEAAFQSGADALNQEYTTRRIAATTPDVPVPPPGVEMVAYHTRTA